MSTSSIVPGKRIFTLGLALAAAVLTVAALAGCTGDTQSAEAAYSAAAGKAVSKAKELKRNADAAIAAGDKPALKNASDGLKEQHAVLEELEPPPVLAEFHTTVVQQVFVVYDTAEQIVVEDLPPEEAQTVWVEVSLEWEVWVTEVWEPWVEEVAAIEDGSEPSTTPEEEADVSDFDGDYEGEAVVTMTVDGTPVGPVPVPITFSVEDGEIILYTDTDTDTEEFLTGYILDSSGSGELTLDLTPFGVAGSITVNVFFSQAGDQVSVEGTISGSISAEGVTASLDGTITADRVA